MSFLLRFRASVPIIFTSYIRKRAVFSTKFNYFSSPANAKSQKNRPIISNPISSSSKVLEKDISKAEERPDGDVRLDRFIIAPQAENVDKFREFLDILKRHRPIPEWAKTGGGIGGGGAAYKSILYTAPYLAEAYDLVEEFTDVVDEWFARIRPIFESDVRRGDLAMALRFSPNRDQFTTWRKPEAILFNIPHHLEYLGRLNEATGGRLAQNLGWENVSFITRRMVECGFFTYSIAEVTGCALTGLRDLYATASTSFMPNPPNYNGLRLWLLALAHYLAGAEQKPMEWHQLLGVIGSMRASLPNILSRLRTLEKVMNDRDDGSAAEAAPLFRYLTRMLCNYAKVHFDHDIVEENQWAVEKGRLSTSLRSTRCVKFLNDYALLWSRYQPEFGDDKKSRPRDPNRIVQDSWRSWYQACDTVLSQLSLTEDLNEEEKSEEHRNEEGLAFRITSHNLAYFRSPTMLRLLYNSLDVAYLFNQTPAFYEFLYDTWKQTFLRVLKRSDFRSCIKEVSFLIPALIRVIIADIGSIDQLAMGNTSPEHPEETPKPIRIEPIWEDRHEDTMELASSLLKDLTKCSTHQVPYRAVNELITALVDLNQLQRSDEKIKALLDDDFLRYLIQWCKEKREQNYAYNASNSATIVKNGISKLDFGRSKMLNSLLHELDLLDALGQGQRSLHTA